MGPLFVCDLAYTYYFLYGTSQYCIYFGRMISIRLWDPEILVHCSHVNMR